MMKSNIELLTELKLPKRSVLMSYFDAEDDRLQARIDESNRLSEGMSISHNKLKEKFSI